MLFQDLFSVVINWLAENFVPLLISAIIIVVGYVIHLILKRQIKRLERKQKLNENTSRNLIKVLKYIIVLIIISAIFFQFAESLGLITTLFSLVGGTIIGFAAMTTLGNAIAGFIIMLSRPFSVGDRILYDNKIVDIADIKLIFTIMVDLNGIKISVPNQKLISDEIIDLGRNSIIRREITITPGFEEDRNKVEKVLLNSVKTVPQVLESPEPYVWINSFQNYAVEYKLFVFIDDVMHLPIIDSDLHKAVLDACKQNNIDIRTPLLHRQIND